LANDKITGLGDVYVERVNGEGTPDKFVKNAVLKRFKLFSNILAKGNLDAE